MTLQDDKPWSNRCSESIAEVRFLASTPCTLSKSTLPYAGCFHAHALNVGLRDWLLSLNEPDEDHNNGNNEEEMQEPAECVRRYKAKEPKHQEDNSDGIQHAQVID